MFSFVLLDESVTPSRVIAARDPIGITTLYQGWSSTKPGTTWFSSELKSLQEECDEIRSFPPGHVYDSLDQSTTRYFQPTWWDGDLDASDPAATVPTSKADLTLLREALEAAVRKRLMSEVPFGVLLSGGLDSSLIASIAARETEKVAEKHREERQKKLAEHRSGPPTPKDALIDEYGNIFSPLLSITVSDTSTYRYDRLLATTPLVLHWPGELAGPARGPEGGPLPRHYPS
jgi:asparagine synthase (glutamine-hydrolysing)